MKKIILVTSIILIFTSCIVFGSTSYDNEANMLKEIGVFKGTDQGFELDRAPTRLEGAVMFVRLLGAESEAKTNDADHPFLDVPEWGSPYIGYLYSNGLTNGISSTEFGSNNVMNAKSYLTFMLRALNYSDANGDFSWALAVEKSNEIGLIDNAFKTDLMNNEFLRDHVAGISYLSLKQNMKDMTTSLSNKLVNDGAFSKDAAISMGVIEGEMSNNYANGSALSKLTQADIIALNADGFTGTDLEIATQIKDWQVSNMIYASSSKNYNDVSYSMRWNYAFPGIYTTKDMIDNMKDGAKIYGICYNYATLYADIANYYGLEVRITNTTVKPSEVSDNPFYQATATGLGPDEFVAFEKWVVSKGFKAEDYPYEAVRLIMAETALHYRAEVKIDNEWTALDTYRTENESANKYEFVEIKWQEGNQAEKFAEYVTRIKNGEDLRGDETYAQTYEGFLQGRLIRQELDEFKDYVGITDDIGQAKRAASQDDLFQGYGLVPYFNTEADILAYMSNLDWLEEEIDEYIETKELIEKQYGINYYVLVEIMLAQEDDSLVPYDVFLEQYLGYTGEDISTYVSESMYKKYIQ